MASAQNPEPAFKIGIIGIGNRSTAHFAAFPKLSEARVVAMCDIESERMRKVNDTLPAKAATFTDYRELIRDKNVSVVVIATPNYLHREMALAALRAGKDVLLEKPIAITYEQARDIQREAERSGRTLAVGMQRRYAREETLLQQVVDSGAIGGVRLITCAEFRGDWYPRSWQYTDPATGKKTNWRMLKKTAGSTELEFSVHAYATFCSLVKSPLARLAASGGVVHYHDDRSTRDLSSIVADFANGARLNYSFTNFASANGSTFTIVGENGMLQRERGQLMVHTRGGKWAPPTPTGPLPSEDPVVLMYREFFQNIRDRKPSVLGAETAIEAAKIAYAAEIAIMENRIVTARDFS